MRYFLEISFDGSNYHGWQKQPKSQTIQQTIEDCISILLKDFPAETEASSPLGPFTVDANTKKVDTRARARYASLKVSNTSTNTSWRYGTFRADVQPDGQR